MTDNDTSEAILSSQSPQNAQNMIDDYFSQIPEANPIQKRQILSPQSIFPFKALPSFKFGKQLVSQTLPSATSTESLEIQSHQFSSLFCNPIYSYHHRTIVSSNLQYGCLQVNYGQSKVHKEIIESETLQNEDSQPELSFESRFESGNLSLAAQSEKPNHYYLLVSRDMNTTKCTQWFFFRVQNRNCGQYFFHILNFIKNYSVFENGMKVCVAKKSEDYRWHRGGENIKYRKTNIPIYNAKRGSGRCYYALTFSYEFNSKDDEVYFSYCYPYTYSMLERFIFKIVDQNSYIKRRNISISPGGNYIDLLTITNFKNKQNQSKRRVVFITSRVHPGQTPSSFVCEGIIKFLIGDSEAAQSLRDNFIFKIVPMLNPDGVINGSYRCSLSGCDLNRVWHRADKISHPQIYGVRKAIHQLSESNLFLFVDLHAHSKKKGVFMYGCQNKANPYICRHLPFLLWKNVPQFNYYQCNFSMRKGRQGTSRLSIYRDLQLGYSYTMEHSFCGPSKQKVHFMVKDFINIGINFVLTLHKFYCRFKKTEKGNLQLQAFKQLYGNKQLMKIGDNDNGDSSSDEQLDQEDGPSELLSDKPPKKLFLKRQKIFNSVGITEFQKPKLNIKSKYKVSPQKIIDIKNETVIKYNGKNSSFPKPLPIIGPNFKGQFVEGQDQIDTNYLFHRSRACFSSLTSTYKNDEQKKFKFRQTYRYSEQEQINSLSNLLLPSLKSASYKKYGKKLPHKNIVQIGKSHIQNVKILKQQIKGVQKKKMGWKQQAKSYL